MATSLVELVREGIIDALIEHKGDIVAASIDLMIGRTTLYAKLKALAIDQSEYKTVAARVARMDRIGIKQRLLFAAELHRQDTARDKKILQIARLVEELLSTRTED